MLKGCVNACHLGLVKTRMEGPFADASIEDCAKTAVRLALLDENGPTGGFYQNDTELPW